MESILSLLLMLAVLMPQLKGMFGFGGGDSETDSGGPTASWTAEQQTSYYDAKFQYQSEINETETLDTVGDVIMIGGGAIAGGLVGAGVGAAWGSIMPGPGTLIGAGIGGLLGLVGAMIT